MLTKVCQACNASFPKYPVINGKTMDFKKRKLCLKCSPYIPQANRKRKKSICPICGKASFNPKFCSSSCSAVASNLKSPKRKPEGNCLSCQSPVLTKAYFCSEECSKNIVHLTCKVCKRNLPVNNDNFHIYDLTGFKYDTCKSCTNSIKKSDNRESKRALVKLGGGECVICGYDKSPLAMSFHHIDPSTKSFDIGARKLEKETLDEIKKCILVCNNCHFEIHHGLHPQYLLSKVSGSLYSDKEICDTTVQRNKLKKKLMDILGGKCSGCGYDKCSRVLSFHHINPAEKEFQIGPNIRIKSYDAVEKEVKKCVLLCANCHSEEHGKV